MAVREFNLPLVGASFRVKRLTRRMISDSLEEEAIGCSLELEPDNEWDDKAVKVILTDYLPDLHIGYIGRPANKALFDLIVESDLRMNCLITSFDYENGTGNVRITTD